MLPSFRSVWFTRCETWISKLIAGCGFFSSFFLGGVGGWGGGGGLFLAVDVVLVMEMK